MGTYSAYIPLEQLRPSTVRVGETRYSLALGLLGFCIMQL